MAGIMEDGFKTTVEFSQDTTIPEMEVVNLTPFGIDLGGPINRTTMNNTAFRTQVAKKLKGVTAMTLTVVYDPALLSIILAIAGVNGSITITFPDSSTWTVWGFIDKAEPGEVAEGDMPTLDLTVEASNRNGSGVETPPAYDDGLP